MIPINRIAYLLGAVAIFAAGLMSGWAIYRPRIAANQQLIYHPELMQVDGSRVLESKPDPNAKPQHQIPAGAKVERVVSVQVRPRSIPAVGHPQTSAESRPVQEGRTLDSGEGRKTIPCPPVTVDLSLVRMKDQTQRVIASSPDGDIVGGLDIPVEQPKVQPDPKWIASGLVGYDVRQKCKVYGGMVSRHAGPFVVHAGVIGQTGFVGVGIRF
jgi:hypothetical protein